MKTGFLFFLLLGLQELVAQTALPIIQSNNSSNLILLTQEKIDEIKSPADGYSVLNSTTGCINYFIQNRWHELCGNCLPKPIPAKVDSLFQRGMSIYIFFKIGENDSLEIDVASLKYKKRFQKSPAIISLYGLENQERIGIKVLATNSCGVELPTEKNYYEIKVSNKKISEVYNLPIENKEYKVRDVNGLTWMLEDFVPSIKLLGFATKKMFSIPTITGICPTDWSVPSAKDWENYFNFSTENFSTLFDKATLLNASIELKKEGFYSIKEDKLYFEYQNGMYWTSKNEDGKGFLMNITEKGYLVVSEKPALIAAKIRCVKAK